jgi:hypothetical protein
VSSQPRLAVVALQAQRAHERFYPRVLSRQACFFLVGLMDVKGLGGMGQKLVPPLVLPGLADLLLVAERRDGLALQAFDDDPGFGVGVPLAAGHG